MWSWFYLVVLHVVRVLPGLGFFMPSGAYYVSIMTWVYALIVHNIFVNGHSSLRDCDVAALPIPDIIDGWQALWIGSSGLLCLDASLLWAEL